MIGNLIYYNMINYNIFIYEYYWLYSCLSNWGLEKYI